MPYELRLPTRWSAQWKVKIYDREGAEEPHVSVVFHRTVWRVSLRSFEFLDREPPPGEVPKELLDAVRVELAALRAAWDRLHAANPVSSQEDQDA